MDRKLLVEDVRAMVDKRISEIVEREGPAADLSLEKIMPIFGSWVLPDHHMDVIRQCVEQWTLRLSKTGPKNP